MPNHSGERRLWPPDSDNEADLAELLASSTTQVGAERAMAAGMAAVGGAALATSLDRLQLPMLSGATRTAMKDDPSLLPDLRQRVEAAGS